MWSLRYTFLNQFYLSFNQRIIWHTDHHESVPLGRLRRISRNDVAIMRIWNLPRHQRQEQVLCWGVSGRREKDARSAGVCVGVCQHHVRNLIPWRPCRGLQLWRPLYFSNFGLRPRTAFYRSDLRAFLPENQIAQRFWGENTIYQNMGNIIVGVKIWWCVLNCQSDL